MEHAELVINGTLVALGFTVVLSLRFAVVRRAWIAVLRSAWGRLQPAEEVDPLVAELWAVDRRARLRRDLERVRRLVATDDWMSATRQLGNRFACRRLEADLRRAVATEALDEGRWASQASPRSAFASALPASAFSSGTASVGQVEILDVGPGRGTGFWGAREVLARS